MRFKSLKVDEGSGAEAHSKPFFPSVPSKSVLSLAAAVALVSYLLSVYYASAAHRALLTTYALCSYGGPQIYSVDAQNSLVDCIVVHNGTVLDVGAEERVVGHWNVNMRSAHGPLTVHVLPKGAIAIPGISDSHGHILEYGASRELPLEGTKTIQEAVARVRSHILANRALLDDKKKVIMGGGWDHTVWPAGRMPTAADLEEDEIVRGRLLILQSKDCHALWISASALKLIGDDLPKEVDGGVVVRDEIGRPTGLLYDNAQELILAKQPAPTYEDLRKRFDVAARDALALGITSVHDAGLDPSSMAFFQRCAISPLQFHFSSFSYIRVYAMRFFDETAEYWGNTSKKTIDYAEGTFTARSVKLFADGALRTGGAALYEPYEDNPSTPGFMRTTPEMLKKAITLFLRDGWQTNVHAIGDRANGIVLDAFEAALHGANVTTLRPRLEHAQMMTLPDMARLGQLGVIASVQPTHVTDDMWYAQDRVGPERIKNLYAFRSLLDNGARLTLGSDFPVEHPNPLGGFFAAITRVSPSGDSPHGPGGWFPEQRLTREEALRGMTIDAAYASFTEHKLGSLEVGKRADFVVFNKNIMTIPVDEILSTHVLATVIDGVPAYGTI
ncbi:hypothetical protein FISHEDRAFT_65887 [Fistulina hepatica ATCC 64428]|uniref:Amidohydrolase 3 domain-containing protein n=1 Tax=Fistulina hepatica ATCC 64428 TaxID=1128425 RepID=A0A0D7AAK4_9AGAR|nr:hypothetical protein FISHEDRAFT_65887 [Fistulina hepatica ATCC 64428]